MEHQEPINWRSEASLAILEAGRLGAPMISRRIKEDARCSVCDDDDKEEKKRRAEKYYYNYIYISSLRRSSRRSVEVWRCENTVVAG